MLPGVCVQVAVRAAARYDFAAEAEGELSVAAGEPALRIWLKRLKAQRSIAEQSNSKRGIP